jgi:transcriptional regulator with XRE-family HTH domain
VVDIGSRIRAARKSAGLSQEELARRANLSLNGVAILERGKRTDPHVSTVNRIADALNVPAQQLLDLKEPPKPAEAGSSREYLERLAREGFLRFRQTVKTDEGETSEDVQIQDIPESWIASLAESLSDIRLAPGDKIEVTSEIRMSLGDEAPKTARRKSLEAYAERDVKVPVLAAS